jgi:carbonic anhydrase
VAISTDGHSENGRDSDIQFVASDFLEFDWKTNLKSAQLKIDGKAVKILGAQGSTKFKGQVYNLTEVVFHARSETVVNGRQPPLEVRFVHKPPLIIASLFDQGARNTEIDSLGWGSVSNDKETKTLPSFTPYKLLPKTVAYYHFLGPLKGSKTLKQQHAWTSQLATLSNLASVGVTKDLCTNEVPWILMHYRGSVSSDALKAFPKAARIGAASVKIAKAIKKVALMYDKFYFGAHEDVQYIRARIFSEKSVSQTRSLAASEIKVGDRFIQLGKWRLGDADGTHFSIAYKSGTKHYTAVIFRKDGTVHNGPRKCCGLAQLSTWGRPIKPSRVTFGQNTIQIGDWRLGTPDGTHFSISHKDGRTAMIFRKDGTVHPGPRSCCGLWQLNTYKQSIKSSNIKFAKKTLQIGDWRLGDKDGAHFSFAHKDKHTAMIYRSDGTVHGGPRSCCGLWQLNCYQNRPVVGTVTGR